ncbi:MAG: DUF3800 domain-containing protein, partial [Chloroflexi bacterium]|nr:DUF3800 domain-containing protein [Chloroflexota bacterium]
PENRQFISYLRRTINGEGTSPEGKRVGDFSVEDSSDVAGLQVADVVAGAIAYRYTEDNDVYRRIIEPVLDECFWPENE